MLKKILLPISVAAMLGFVACDESTTSAKAEDQSSSSVDASSSSVADSESSSSAKDESSSSVEAKSSSSVKNPLAGVKATCEITKKEDNSIAMKASVQDSVTSVMDMTIDGTKMIVALDAEFADGVSQDVVDEACAEAKAAAEEAKAEESAEAEVECDGKKISSKTTTDLGPMASMMSAMILPTVESTCEQIQKTGVIPEDLGSGVVGGDDDATDIDFSKLVGDTDN